MDVFRNDKNLYDKYSGVIELTSKDFKYINGELIIINPEFKNKDGLINFYAPWCSHCNTVVEMWSELAIQFKNKFIIASVNCENKKNQIIKIRANVDCYPTFKYISANGRLHNLDNIYKKDDFINFIAYKLI